MRHKNRANEPTAQIHLSDKEVNSKKGKLKTNCDKLNLK